jgi:hypothetical protein
LPQHARRVFLVPDLGQLDAITEFRKIVDAADRPWPQPLEPGETGT